MNKDRTCNNCAHYFQHYGWIADKFRKIECGHCLKRKLTKTDYSIFPYSYCCDIWQPKEKEIAERRERLEATLTRMAIEINDILTLIENGYLHP